MILDRGENLNIQDLNVEGTKERTLNIELKDEISYEELADLVREIYIKPEDRSTAGIDLINFYSQARTIKMISEELYSSLDITDKDLDILIQIFQNSISGLAGDSITEMKVNALNSIKGLFPDYSLEKIDKQEEVYKEIVDLLEKYRKDNSWMCFMITATVLKKSDMEYFNNNVEISDDDWVNLNEYYEQEKRSSDVSLLASSVADYMILKYPEKVDFSLHHHDINILREMLPHLKNKQRAQSLFNLIQDIEIINADKINITTSGLELINKSTGEFKDEQPTIPTTKKY